MPNTKSTEILTNHINLTDYDIPTDYDDLATYAIPLDVIRTYPVVDGEYVMPLADCERFRVRKDSEKIFED